MVSAIQPYLDAIVGVESAFHVHGDAGVAGGLEVDYHVLVDTAAGRWLGPLNIPLVTLSGGLFRVRISGSGWASRLYRSGVFNVGAVSLSDLSMRFEVDQFLMLSFDGPSERLVLATVGAPVVSLDYLGPFANSVTPVARNAIASRVQASLGGMLAHAQNALQTLTEPGKKNVLIDQLKTIDSAAGVRFDAAIFEKTGSFSAAASLSRRGKRLGCHS